MLIGICGTKESSSHSNLAIQYIQTTYGFNFTTTQEIIKRHIPSNQILLHNNVKDDIKSIDIKWEDVLDKSSCKDNTVIQGNVCEISSLIKLCKGIIITFNELGVWAKIGYCNNVNKQISCWDFSITSIYDKDIIRITDDIFSKYSIPKLGG